MDKILKPFSIKMDSEICKYISEHNICPTFDEIYGLQCFNIEDPDWKRELNKIYNTLIIKYKTTEIKHEKREYQKKYIDSSINVLSRHGSVLIHAPTGSGKTYMIMNIISHIINNNAHSLHFLQKNIVIVFVSPLLDINDQCVADKYINILQHKFNICKFNSRYGFDIPNEYIDNNIIVSTTYKSLGKALCKLEEYKKKVFFAVFDECHTMGEDIQKITLQYADNIIYKLYASATPLDYQITDDCYGKYIRFVNEKDLMDANYLSKLNTYISKSLDDKKLSVIESIITFIKKTGSKKICCFVNTISNGIKLYNELKSKIPSYGLYKYFATDSMNVIDEFAKNHNISIIISCKKLCMGVDIPCIDAIIFVDNKMSYIDISQCIGRGLRKYVYPDNSLKTCNLLLFDCYDNNNILQYLHYMTKSCGFEIKKNTEHSGENKGNNELQKNKNMDTLVPLCDYNGSINIDISLYAKFKDKHDMDIYEKYKTYDMTIIPYINIIQIPNKILIINVSSPGFRKTHFNFINSVIYRIINCLKHGIWGFKDTQSLKKIYNNVEKNNNVIMFDKDQIHLFQIVDKQIDKNKTISTELWSENWNSAYLHIYLKHIKSIKNINPRKYLNNTLKYSEKYNWQGPTLIHDEEKIISIISLFNTT